MKYAMVGYQFNRPSGAFGFGRCFATNLDSLPQLEASLSKEGGFSGCSVISLTRLTKAEYMQFKRKKFL